jgi:hypothetical protein
LCNYARAAVWAADVELRAGKTLTAVERDFIRDTAPHRLGCPQPKAWTKYLRGKRTPTPPGPKKSEVTWAEQAYPGTMGSYQSVLWMLLDRYQAKQCVDSEWPLLIDQLDPQVRHSIDADNWVLHGYLLPRLGIAGFQSALDQPHLDAFVILLFQVLRSPIYEPPEKPLVYAALWLQRWLRKDPVLKRTQKIFSELLYTYVQEFSFLREGATFLNAEESNSWLASGLQDGLRKLLTINDDRLADRFADGLLDETFFGGTVQ